MAHTKMIEGTVVGHLYYLFRHRGHVDRGAIELARAATFFNSEALNPRNPNDNGNVRVMLAFKAFQDPVGGKF